MTRIDRFLIRMYLGPFIMSLSIVMFILVLLVVYPYMQEIMGKGISPSLLGKLVFYATGKVLLWSMPIGIIAAALMTFGGLGEHNELAAIKSSGISLVKIMRAPVVLSLVLTGFCLWFAFEIVPRANLKFFSLYYDLQKKKADVAIKPGFFYGDIDDYVIRVADKHPDNGTLYDVMIYNHSEKRGNADMILADSARMYLQGGFMRMVLYEGSRYEEYKPESGKPNNHPHGRTYFDSLIYRFELKGFDVNRTDESQFRHQIIMPQPKLVAALDSITNLKDKTRKKNYDQVGRYNKIDSNFTTFAYDTLPRNLGLTSLDLEKGDDIARCFPDLPTKDLYERALVNIRAAKSYSEFMIKKKKDQERHQNNYNFEYYQRFALPFNCIVFMMIGISLGAIIRKGGLGIPALISVICFVAFYLAITYGKKFAKEDVVAAWLGAWLPVLIFTPLAFFATVQATTESSIFNESFWEGLWQRLTTNPIEGMGERWQRLYTWWAKRDDR